MSYYLLGSDATWSAFQGELGPLKGSETVFLNVALSDPMWH